ncbi:Hypothetical_protein [Hexamita inflata]|uniref:Hypothetical_protein n=1 Tax=Hexamita inflata TaxID=28002 RepID=A0AA86RM01_9EUKA|nr:Hypothetical protein HINF_LOCUS64918 [Hexamita inflata]
MKRPIHNRNNQNIYKPQKLSPITMKRENSSFSSASGKSSYYIAFSQQLLLLSELADSMSETKNLILKAEQVNLQVEVQAQKISALNQVQAQMKKTVFKNAYYTVK